MIYESPKLPANSRVRDLSHLQVPVRAIADNLMTNENFRDSELLIKQLFPKLVIIFFEFFLMLQACIRFILKFANVGSIQTASRASFLNPRRDFQLTAALSLRLVNLPWLSGNQLGWKSHRRKIQSSTLHKRTPKSRWCVQYAAPVNRPHL